MVTRYLYPGVLSALLMAAAPLACAQAGGPAGHGAPAAPSAAPLRSDVMLGDGRHMSYLEWGTASQPVLLLLHGKGSSAAELAPFAAELARHFHVVAPDARGCGFSDWARDGDYTVESMAGDLEQLVAALGLRRFALYGHSLGAVTAIAYAARNPSHTALLMLEDGGPVTLSDGSNPALNPGQSAPAGAPTPAPAEQRFASWGAMVAAQPPSRGTAPLTLEARFVRGADGQVRRRNDVIGLWKTKRGEAFTQPWPLVRALSMPTLLIRAERGLLPEPIAREMTSLNLNIRYQTVMGAGHNVHGEKPGAVMALVSAFWAQHGNALHAN
jgi:pimeloyl-ACP methyl ester carboxylesterase